MSQPDLFDLENLALLAARAVHDDAHASPAQQQHALGDLIASYERLLRETRRLVRRSDREELEMNQLNQRLQELAAELKYRASHDSLTGVLNRAAVIEHSNRMLLQGGLALIVVDIDHFKQVNDSFGHPAGDRVICGVVDCLKALVPDKAQVGRVGGEEFTVLLSDQSCEQALLLAEQMRESVASHPFQLPGLPCITASFGVSCLPRHSSFDIAYRRADDALYAAKREGRNRVVCTDPTPDVTMA
jgi:diguanylate cyclase (GGDEF)-like protein